jgi:hypothetical protein
MTRILNLDSVKPAEERVLKLNGREHAMKPMSVGDFIDNSRTARVQEGGADPATEFELVLGMVARAFPTIPADELRGLTFAQLNTILSWSESGVGPAEGSAEGNGDAAETKAA